MAVFETWLRSDLKQAVNVVQLRGNFFSQDSQGNLIGVEVFDNGEHASLTGTVMGYIIRGDGATVSVTGTLADGYRAYIVLPASAYGYVGEIRIAIKIGDTTVGACVGYVYRTTTDAFIDPGHVVPSLSELLAQIGACRTATANANKVANLTVSAEAATGTTPDAILSEDQQTGNKHVTFKLVRGAKGDTGNTGATGATPNISIGNVQSGATPSASMTGTPENPVLNMTFPKGDTGDAATIYIRYASAQPTQDSDMKTTPDEWMGIYAGDAETAPTHYTDYTWYKIKGETGSIDNASAATIPMSSTDSTKIATAMNGKADKVIGGTAGNFAILDANGNIDDSGSKASDFLTSHQDVSGKANAGAVANFANGDTHGAVNAGEFLYVANHNTLSTGLYIATANIAQDGALSASNVTSVPHGLGGYVTDINSKLSSLFIVKAYTYTASVSASSYLQIPASSFKDSQGNAVSTPDGYTPVGIQYYSTAASNLFAWSINATATGSTTMVALKNVSTSAQSDRVIRVNVLYIKSNG